MGIWLRDPLPEELKKLQSRLKLKKKDALSGNGLMPPNVQSEMIKIGAFSPTTTFHDTAQPNHPKSGYRTSIPIDIKLELPAQSLIYVKDMSCVSVDGCHASTRVVEKDIKLISEYLLTRGRLENFKVFEYNGASRGIKSNSFTLKGKGNKCLSGSSEIDEVSLGFKDARTLIASPEDLPDTDTVPLFKGVMRYDRAVPNCHERSIEILKELDLLNDGSFVPDTEIPQSQPNERAITELLFHSHNMITKFYRDPSKTVADVDELIKWVEAYFHCNMLMFSDVKSMTPYKAKLVLLIELLKAGNIRSLFEMMTEVTENSNHGSHHLFQNHTVRDGGRIDRNVSSEFCDLFQSFMHGVELGIKCGHIKGSQMRTIMGRHGTSSESDCFEKYLNIVTTAVHVPVLQIGKVTEGEQLRGLHFNMIGDFHQLTGMCSSLIVCHYINDMFGLPICYLCLTIYACLDLDRTDESIRTITTAVLQGIVTSMGGTLLGSSMDTLSERHKRLQHCYVVLADDHMLQNYMNPVPPTAPPSTTGNARTKEFDNVNKK